MNYAPIKITLNLEKLQVLNDSLNTLGHEPIEDRAQRVFRAILKEVNIRLIKKQLDVFPQKKDFSFKLKYYEADVLEQWCLFYIKHYLPVYEKNLLQKLAYELNQKLA